MQNLNLQIQPEEYFLDKTKRSSISLPNFPTNLQSNDNKAALFQSIVLAFSHRLKCKESLINRKKTARAKTKIRIKTKDFGSAMEPLLSYLI